MGFFSRGVIFAKKTKVRKKQKLPPRETFHVYSIMMYWDEEEYLEGAKNGYMKL